MRVRRRFRFEAAHQLPNHPGKCRELHGHSFELHVMVERPVDPHSGMTLDFAEIKRVVQSEAIEHLDHRFLNEFLDNPTAERIAIWIWRRLAEPLPGLIEIELFETRDCSVVYRGD